MEFGEEESLIQIFEKQVNLNPLNTALEEPDGERTTYKNLSSFANIISLELNAKILKSQSKLNFVAVLVDNGKNYVAASLAILKCGLAFVPLDSTQPVKRLRTILEDLNDPFLITESLQNPLLKELHYSKENLLKIDLILDAKTDQNGETNGIDNPTEWKQKNYSKTDIMYCLYTSGSTGKPKGVLIETGSVMNWIQWCIAESLSTNKSIILLLIMFSEFQLSSKDRSLAFSSPTFDISIGQIFQFLAIGATVVLPHSWTHVDKLHDYVVDKKITFLFLPTIVAETFFEINPTRFPALKWLLFVGEMLRNYGYSLPGNPEASFQICNCYGPTEATITVTSQKFRPGEIITLSVGKAIMNHKIYIMNDFMNEITEPGIIGTVYIEGIGVTNRGYHNRPEATNDYFIIHKGKRLCKPGDLGVWRSDGTLEIRGRTDDQIKINGLRFELNEIEYHLTQHPFIKQAVITYDSAVQLILGHVVLHPNKSISEETIKLYLLERLPKVAVPSRIYFLSTLPLSTTGKVDKNKLFELANVIHNHNKAQIPKFTTLEDIQNVLLEILSNILKLERNQITLDSNFFGLGGNSLYAQQLISNIKTIILLHQPQIQCQKYIRFATIFNNPTPRALANVCFDSLNEESESFNFTTHTNLNKCVQKYNKCTFPLSLAQEQIWLSMLEYGSTSYFNVLRKIRFNEQINISQLRVALTRIIEENVGLRVAFIEDHLNGTLYQEIKPSPLEEVCIEESSCISERKISEMWNIEFDLAKGHLYKFFISKCKSELYVLYHHLIMDGYGWKIFIQSLDKYYYQTQTLAQSFIQNSNKSESKYISTILLERDQQFKDTSKFYWIEKMKHFKPTELMEINYSASVEGKTLGKNYILMEYISPEISQLLLEYAKTNHTTLFVVLLTIYKLLLYRYNNETDQTILTLFRSGASHDDDDILGHFVNVIPIRTITKPNTLSITQFLELVKQSVVNGLEHGEIPFQNILKACKISGVERDILLQNMFQMTPNILPKLLTCKEVYMKKVGFSRINFGMDVNTDSLSEDGILLSIEYNPAKYSSDFVKQFLNRFQELSKSIVLHHEELEESCLEQLNILPSSEKQKILNEFAESKQTVVSLGNSGLTSILDAFQKQVKKNSHAIAIQDDTEFGSEITLSYRDLEESSNLIQQEIFNLEQIIGTTEGTNSNENRKFLVLLLQRNHIFITASIAGMKAQRILVPLSVSATTFQIENILKDLGEEYIFLACSETKHLVPSSVVSSKRLIFVEQIFNVKEINAVKPKILFPETESISTITHCYFTSGTTSTPKGVLIRMKSILNCTHNYVNSFNITSLDSCLFIHNPGFDASLMDFLPGLTQGAKIYIPDSSMSYNPNGLWNYICQNKITFANIPTSLAKYIFTNYNPISNSLVALRYLVVGGERLKIAPPLAFPVKCINAYGPTEVTVDATFSEVDMNSVKHNIIGRPLANVKIYILDDYLRPVPIGILGVIWIGGHGVASYLKRPELNARMFRENPFCPSDRIFNSGDKGNWNSDGTISISYRIDQQVKINGFRVELEEIESIISSHVEVQEAAVIAIENRNKSSVLISYIVSKIFTPLPSTLREFLSNRLPYYAIPSVFIPLQNIPLTSNMKIDRKKLEVHYHEHYSTNEIADNYQRTALTETEKTLVEIWSNQLDVSKENIFPLSSFYVLGGSSMNILILLQKIKSAFQLDHKELNFRDLLQASTISSQAHYIERCINSQKDNQSKSKMKLTSNQESILFKQIFESTKSLPYFSKSFIIKQFDKSVVKSIVTDLVNKYHRYLGLKILINEAGQIETGKFESIDLEKAMDFHFQSPDHFKNVLPTCAFPNFEYQISENSNSKPYFAVKTATVEQKHLLIFFWHPILDTSEIKLMFGELLACTSLQIESSEHWQNEETTKVNGKLVNGDPENHTVLQCQNSYPLFSNNLSTSEEHETTKSWTENNIPAMKIWKGLISKVISMLLRKPLREILSYIDNPHTEPVLHISLSKLVLFHDTLKKLSGTQNIRGSNLSNFMLYHQENLQKLVSLMGQYKPVPQSNKCAINCIFENELEELKKQLVPSKMQAKNVTCGRERDNNAKVVFLTGSTGYLGAFILENLLENPLYEKIYCLVRGNPSRLMERLKQFQINVSEKNLEKIKIVNGDLTLHKFGLDKQIYNEILNNVELICHCGAKVNLIAPYDELQSSNVNSTLALCKIALEGKRMKSFHYISSSDSTVGRFAFEEEDQIMDLTIPSHPPYLDLGYYQTKWVSEKLVEFISDEVPSNIYRVGTVGSPSGERAIINTSSFDGIFVRACILLKAYPLFRGFTVPYSDVDYAAQIICTEFPNAHSSSTKLNLMNVVQKNYFFPDLFNTLISSESTNSEYSPLHWNEWFKKFQDHCQLSTSDTLVQQLLVIFNQSPWGNFLEDTNYYTYFSNMPIIGYPTRSDTKLQMIVNREYKDFVETSIKKYILLHGGLYKI